MYYVTADIDDLEATFLAQQLCAPLKAAHGNTASGILRRIELHASKR